MVPYHPCSGRPTLCPGGHWQPPTLEVLFPSPSELSELGHFGQGARLTQSSFHESVLLLPRAGRAQLLSLRLASWLWATQSQSPGKPGVGFTACRWLLALLAALGTFPELFFLARPFSSTLCRIELSGIPLTWASKSMSLLNLQTTL